MHVLRLTPHFYWPQLEDRGWPVAFDTIGGMQTQIFRQTLELSGLGVRQTVLSLRIPGVEPSWKVNGRLHVLGVRVPVLPVRSRTRGMIDLNISWFLGVARELERSIRNVDVVHVHCSGVSWPLLIGWWAARRLGAPLVLTIHCSMIATYHPMHRLDRILLPWMKRLERRVIRGAAHTIALTRRSYDLMVEAGYADRGSISIIPDCLDVTNFQAQATPERVARFAERFDIPTDRAIVTYVGRVAREKGWRHLLDMAARLGHRRIHFLVCGDGNECDLLRQGVRDRGLEERFTITGYVPLNDVPLALANSSVLVLPSVHEEFGGVLIEAMAMGVPSVAFAVGGVPHVQRHGVTGLLVEPGSVEGLCAAVERLLDEPELAHRMGAASRRHVRARFSLAQSCNRLHDIYRRVLMA